jgi:hypothetical protein
VLAGPVLASRRTTSMRVLLAGGLQRVGQLGGGLGHRSVGVDDVGQVVAAAGVVELLYCGVEVDPELGWAAAAGTGAQLVGVDAQGALDRARPAALPNALTDPSRCSLTPNTIRKMSRSHRRGTSATRTEWRLITATHNLTKLHGHTLASATA